MRRTSILACIAAAPLLAGASQPVRLPPATPWVLDYAADSCRLIRRFGKPTDPTILLFESASPGSMSMLAIGKPLRTAGATRIPARFVPVDSEGIEGESAKSTDDRKPAVLWASVYLPPGSELKERKLKEQLAKKGQRPPPIDLAARAAEQRERIAFAAKVTGIEIEARRKRPVILETGSLGRAMQMLEQCTRDQLRHWGVNPDLEAKIVRPVWAPTPHLWFRSEDYPRVSIHRGEQSVVEFRLLVDAAGVPTKCTSLSHVDAPEFQQVVCDTLMKRARFAPAELADGTKVPSYYTGRISWRIDG